MQEAISENLEPHAAGDWEWGRKTERINQPEKAQVHCHAAGLEKGNKEHSLFGKGTSVQFGVTRTIVSSVAFFVYIKQLQRISRLEKWFCPFSYFRSHSRIQIKSRGAAQQAAGHSSSGQDGAVHEGLTEKGWWFEINPRDSCKGGRREEMPHLCQLISVFPLWCVFPISHTQIVCVYIHIYAYICIHILKN